MQAFRSSSASGPEAGGAIYARESERKTGLESGQNLHKLLHTRHCQSDATE